MNVKHPLELCDTVREYWIACELIADACDEDLEPLARAATLAETSARATFQAVIHTSDEALDLLCVALSVRGIDLEHDTDEASAAIRRALSYLR